MNSNPEESHGGGKQEKGRVGGQGAGWRRRKELEKKERRRMYQCLRAAGELPGAL